ncbi:unnamed protein product [Rhizophagus irregularis]|nr:unnamed protein product [Rhizophagus irregularis]
MSYSESSTLILNIFANISSYYDMLSESYYEKITRIASKMTNNVLSHSKSRHTQRILPTVRQSIRKCSTISSSVGVLYGLSTWQADYTSNRPIHEKLKELDEKISKLEEKVY